MPGRGLCEIADDPAIPILDHRLRGKGCERIAFLNKVEVRVENRAVLGGMGGAEQGECGGAKG